MSEELKPVRPIIDWQKAKYGNCGCGAWAAIAEGQCPKCHDEDYATNVKAADLATITRLRSAMQEAAEIIRLSSCGFCHKASGVLIEALKEE